MPEKFILCLKSGGHEVFLLGPDAAQNLLQDGGTREVLTPTLRAKAPPELRLWGTTRVTQLSH